MLVEQENELKCLVCRRAYELSWSEGGITIIKILLIIVMIAAIYCLGAAIACLISTAREIELPDIEDIEIGE